MNLKILPIITLALVSVACQNKSNVVERTKASDNTIAQMQVLETAEKAILQAQELQNREKDLDSLNKLDSNK